MNLQDLFPADEKPLDRLCPDGGFTKIFRRIACVGDSLSSGEFQALSPEGTETYHDFFEHSWGQYLGRSCGSTVLNFSRGGMGTKEYCETFGDRQGFFNPSKACDAYIIALGCNDFGHLKMEPGSAADICVEDYHKNAKTFCGYYGEIISRYRAIQPRAKFFLVTLPRDLKDGSHEKQIMHARLMYEIASCFPNTYVIDLLQYGPVYDEDFHRKFFLREHMNPCGYVLTARLIGSYIDYIIRHNMEDFSEVGFIGTDLHG